MKLQTLRALVCIEELGSIRAAAQQLHLTQPSLTTAIQQLEEELCAPLLVRSQKGVTFTSFGQTFMRRARLIVNESQRAQEEMAQLRGHWEGHLRFSMSPAVALTVLPEALGPFLKQFPAMNVHCMDGGYPGVTPALRDGTLDFALTPTEGEDTANDLVSEPLFTTDVVVVAHREHAKARAESLKDLMDCHWVFSTATRGPGAIIEKACALAKLQKPICGMVCESLMALPGVVAHTEFLTTMPKALFEKNAFREQLCVVPIKEQIPTLTICMLRRHDLPLTPAAQELVKWIKHFALKKLNSHSQNFSKS